VSSGETLLEVEELSTSFFTDDGEAKAVDGVSFTVCRGETLALVGESGSGKTTIGRAILRLLRPAAGRISVDGKDITTLSRAELRPMRRQVQMIFQDPYSSLDPRLTVQQTISEALAIHRIGRRRDWPERVAALLERVGLPPDACARIVPALEEVAPGHWKACIRDDVP
jgi:peptide/nickel transport system ATP-binding protein